MPTATDRTTNQRPRTSYFSPAQKRSLRRCLFAWYQQHARDLPWRRSRDPYRVWISEIMLQQTQVATVRDYFERFVDALPDVHRLAAADETQVLRLWEGLGYYRRARQLHVAAQKIVAEFGGHFPQNEIELQSLPGIGRYTAGAIASIAFNRRAPILEANTVRLLSRLIGYAADPLRSHGQKVLWHVAEEILPQKNVAHFNQALMELGSLVCTPTEPDCPRCPLSSLCVARSEGTQHQIPPAKLKPAATNLHEIAVIIRKSDRLLMRQCGAGERWAGLWDFPRFRHDAARHPNINKSIIANVAAQTGIACRPGPLLNSFKHTVTRYRITLDCYQAAPASGRLKSTPDQPVRWISTTAFAELPLSTTGRKIARLATASPNRAPNAP